MMTGRLSNINYRTMLDILKKSMDKKEVKPASKADNEEKTKKN